MSNYPSLYGIFDDQEFDEDEEFDEERYREYRDEHRCSCGDDGIDQCDCCGVDMCPMCFELGAGFCKNCPTEEWIAEQIHNQEPDEDIPF